VVRYRGTQTPFGSGFCDSSGDSDRAVIGKPTGDILNGWRANVGDTVHGWDP